MKKLILFAILAGTLAASAATDPNSASAKPTCGSTVAECQKKVDELSARPTMPVDQARVLESWLLSDRFNLMGSQVTSLETILGTLNNFIVPPVPEQPKK